jgi:hypothetical protein
MLDGIVQHLGEAVIQDRDNVLRQVIEDAGFSFDLSEYNVFLQVKVAEYPMKGLLGRHCPGEHLGVDSDVSSAVGFADQPKRAFALELLENPVDVRTRIACRLDNLRGAQLASLTQTLFYEALDVH